MTFSDGFSRAFGFSFVDLGHLTCDRAMCDMVLHLKMIRQKCIKGFGPQLATVACLNKLGSHTYATLRQTHA